MYYAAADQSVAAAAYTNETHNQVALVGSIKGGPAPLHFGHLAEFIAVSTCKMCLGRH